MNLSGQVIGVNSAVDTGQGSTGGVQAHGLGFAIPIDTARRVANELLADGHATKPVLGVSGSLENAMAHEALEDTDPDTAHPDTTENPDPTNTSDDNTEGDR